MEIAQINQRIAVLNADSKRLNNDRAMNIGKKETLQKQLDEALATYKTTYGVDLTEANLQAEINRVSSEKIKEIEKIESVLNLIKTGQYTEANALVNGTPAQTEQVATPVAKVQPVVQETPTSSGVVPPVQTYSPKPPVTGVVPPVPTPPVEPPTVTPPVEPPTVTPPVESSIPTPPVLDMPTQSNTPNLSGLDMSVPDLGMPPADPVVSEPKPAGQPVASFNAILGGSPFKPQGEI